MTSYYEIYEQLINLQTTGFLRVKGLWWNHTERTRWHREKPTPVNTNTTYILGGIEPWK